MHVSPVTGKVIATCYIDIVRNHRILFPSQQFTDLRKHAHTPGK